MSRSRNRRRNRQSSARGPQAEQPQQAAAQALETEGPAVAFDPDYPFADVDDHEQGQVIERQLMLLLKDWRKGRATRSIWSVFTDGYVAVFSIGIIAAMVISAIRSAQKQAAGCTSEGCGTARELIPWLVVAACWVAVLAVSRVFGPVIASAAEGFWLLDAPLRRSAILARRLWLMIVGAGLVGAALGALSTRLLGQVLPAVPAATISADPAAPADTDDDADAETRVTGTDTRVTAAAGDPTGAAAPGSRPRLLLVAPNVLSLQRRHGLDLADLATWVAMHETVHTVQLAAAPWLADHLVARAREVLGAVVGAQPGGGGLARIAAIAGAAGLGETRGLAEVAGLAELRSTLAFLEGHAQAALDGVTPARIPSAHLLRAVLDADAALPPERASGQGGGRGPFAALARGRLLHGAQAARFARGVVALAGHEGLNRAWASPWALPTAAELASPEAWLERVGGGSSAAGVNEGG